jgi:hypothetical protein
MVDCTAFGRHRRQRILPLDGQGGGRGGGAGIEFFPRAGQPFNTAAFFAFRSHSRRDRQTTDQTEKTHIEMDKLGKVNLGDSIETINGSIIQHGHHNGRIYIMHLDTRNVPCLIDILDKMAVENGYEKIFAKIPADRWEAFEDAGYVKEAIVPGFFNFIRDGLFIAKFFSKRGRRRPSLSIGV